MRTLLGIISAIFLTLIQFNLHALEFNEAGKVNLYVQNLTFSSDSYASYEIVLVNNTSIDIKNITMTVDSSILDGGKSGIEKLDAFLHTWTTNAGAKPTNYYPKYINNDQQVLFRANFNGKLKKGTKEIFRGGLPINKARFTGLAGMVLGYSDGNKDIQSTGTIQFNTSFKDLNNSSFTGITGEITAAIAVTDLKAFKMPYTFKIVNGKITNPLVNLPAPQEYYIVFPGDIYMGTNQFKSLNPKFEYKKLTPSGNINLDITYSQQKVQMQAFHIYTDGLETGEKVPLDITSENGYHDTSKCLENGDKFIEVPAPSKNVSYKIAIPKANSGVRPSKNSLTVNTATIASTDSHDISFSPRGKYLTVGYWESWNASVKMADAAINNYNTIIVAFGEVKGSSINLFGSAGLTIPSLVSDDMKKARANGAELILLSFGGQDTNNTFKPKWAVEPSYLPTPQEIEELASNLISFIRSNGFDGIDFDLEIGLSDTTFNNLLKKIKELDKTMIITCAPQLYPKSKTEWEKIRLISHFDKITGKSSEPYESALKDGSFDYVFLQIYNSPEYKIGIYNETDIEFISASFNYILTNNLISKKTVLIPGEPTSKAGGWADGEIYGNKKYNSDSELIYKGIIEQIKLLQDKPQFGGFMGWSIQTDANYDYKADLPGKIEWAFGENVMSYAKSLNK